MNSENNFTRQLSGLSSPVKQRYRAVYRLQSNETDPFQTEKNGAQDRTTRNTLTDHRAPSSGQSFSSSKTLVYNQTPAELMTSPSASAGLCLVLSRKCWHAVVSIKLRAPLSLNTATQSCWHGCYLTSMFIFLCIVSHNPLFSSRCSV